MWPFSSPTVEELQSKAYLIYTEFGTKATIPRGQRLRQSFPEIDEVTIDGWIHQFEMIEPEVRNFVTDPGSVDYEALKHHLSEKFPFMNKKALERAAYLEWFSNLW